MGKELRPVVRLRSVSLILYLCLVKNFAQPEIGVPISGNKNLSHACITQPYLP
jgi:hypothetical protein